MVTKPASIGVNVLAVASVVAIGAAIWAWFGWPAALCFFGFVGLFVSVSVVVSDQK